MSIPPEPGVYCVRTATKTVGSAGAIIGAFKRSKFMQAEKARDEASAMFFRQVGLAQIYGWEYYKKGAQRVDRLHHIDVVGGNVKCPILYFGSTKHLRQRLDELAFGGHTANYAIWALLQAGWRLEIGWREAADHKAREDELKDRFRRRHGRLPPLMDR